MTTPQNTIATDTSILNTLVQDTHYAVALVNAVKAVQDTGSEFELPGQRFWLSPQRRTDSGVWDVLILNFRNPVSITALTFDLREFAQEWEFWYYENSTCYPTDAGDDFIDTSRRLPVLDRSLRQLKGQIDTGVPDKWYSYSYHIRPLVARALEFRIRRRNDGTMPADLMTSVGVRNLLCQREIYSEQDAMLPLEPGVDPIGNLVDSFIKKWEPNQATDGDPYTFWKSSPMPAPDAVVDFYVDIRDDAAAAQRVDRMYLDPAYTGMALNLYYSLDDTVGPRTLNLSRYPPTVENDVNWIEHVGLDMTSSTAVYTLATDGFNVDTTKSVWVAGTWIPGFQSAVPPAVNLHILSSDTNSISITYQSTLDQFQVTWGSYTDIYPCGPVYPDQNVHFSLMAVQANNHSNLPVGVYFVALDDGGNILAVGGSTTAPDTFVFPGTMSLNYCQGYIKNLFIKQDAAADTERLAALLDMSAYLFPQTPVLPDNQGVFGQNSLSNMVYGADFTVNEYGFGGTDHLYFTEKEWTPVWADWVANKGVYYFPTPIYAKYLKIEFTNLTAEAYPINNAGISVQYQSFPINVEEMNQNISNTTTTFIDTRTTQTNIYRGICYDNYYKITTSDTQQSTTSATTSTGVPIYLVNVGSQSIDTVPHSFDQPITSSLISESYTDVTTAIYHSTNTQVLAKECYDYVVSGDCLLQLGKTFNIPWEEIDSCNRELIDDNPRTPTPAQRTPGWWCFPGCRVRIPASIMEEITRCSTTVEKTVSTTNITTRRNRFVKTQVHRYEMRTATRDAAIAYFAGIRDIEVYRLDYTTAEDTEVYNFPLYDNVTFDMFNMQQFAFSGAFGSTAILQPLNGLFPDPTVFPSETLFPQAPTGLVQSNATWADATHEWADTGAVWGFVPPPLNGTIVSHTWESISLVNGIEIKVFDRGFQQPLTGFELAPYSVSDAPVGYWSADAEEWGDEVVVWGTRQSLVAEEFRSKIQFNGQSAYSVYRQAGIGIAGLVTSFWSMIQHTRVRVTVDYYRPVATTNDMIIQILDMSDPLNERVVFEEKINQYYIGRWTTYSTRFHSLGDYPIRQARARLLLQGVDAEQLYVGRMFPQLTTIVYEFSNDGGLTYYEATEAVVSTSTINGLVFPAPENQLKMRCTLYDPDNDFVFGIMLTPEYI